MKYAALAAVVAMAPLLCTYTAEAGDTPAALVPISQRTVITSGKPTVTSTAKAGNEKMPAESPLEEAILNQAEHCTGSKVGKFDRTLLRDMLQFEEDYKVPRLLRGMVLAAACVESGFDPGMEGDHRFSKDGKTPLAIGILQQWPWWSKSPRGPKINRRDPRQAAKAWVAHVVRQVPSVQRKCDFRATQVEPLWRTAWVTAIRAPAKKPRCTQVSKHWRTFLSWRTTWYPLLKPETVARK